MCLDARGTSCDVNSHYFVFWSLLILRSTTLVVATEEADNQAKGLHGALQVATLEQRHQLMNTEATVDNNFELFEAQRVEEIKVRIQETKR